MNAISLIPVVMLIRTCRLDISHTVSHQPAMQKLFPGSSEVLWCPIHAFLLRGSAVLWPLEKECVLSSLVN